MSPESRFLIDADVFIQAYRQYYPFEVVPGFWEALIRYHRNGRLASIDRVKRELELGKDDLARWAAREMPPGAWLRTDQPAVVQQYGKIMTWVQAQQQFMPAAKADFARGADGWLVAYAKVEDWRVVTQEVAAPDAKKKVPIPNVCQEFGVAFGNVFGMLKQLGARFDLSSN